MNLLNPLYKFIDFQAFCSKHLVIISANIFLRSEFSFDKTLLIIYFSTHAYVFDFINHFRYT